jgi:RecB family exonuclease
MRHISYSKINSFITCPLKYNFQYIEKADSDPVSSSSQQLGKYIHEVLEHWREGLDIFELGKLFEAKWIIADEELKVVPRLLENAKQMYQPYFGMPFESEFELEHKLLIPNAEEVLINGIVDKLYKLPDNKYAIIDFKTGRGRIDTSLQMKFYVYLLWKSRGYKPEDIVCQTFWLRTQQTVTHQFDTGTIQEFENWLFTMNEIVDNMAKYKHQFSSACSYCNFKNTACIPYKIRKEKYGV